MKTLVRKSIQYIFFISLAANILFIVNKDDRRIKPREGKDCTIEMKSFITGEWQPMILVHGYADNYPVAEFLVKIAEKEEAEKGGRKPESFRTVRH